MTLTPAYGRDYPNSKAVKADWEANKDFVITDISSPDDGRMINKQDAPKGAYKIRYKKLTQICVVTVK